MKRKPVVTSVSIRVDLSNGYWLELERRRGDTQGSSNFNWDDTIDGSKIEEALNKLEEALQ